MSVKFYFLAKQTQVPAEKTRGAGIEVPQKLHEETWNAVSNLCWQSAQDPCCIVFENCRCSWNRSTWCSDLKIFYFQKIFRYLLHNTIDAKRGAKEDNSLGAESLRGCKKSQQCHKHFFQNCCFEIYRSFASERPQVRTWGAKLVSCPRRHLTSLRPCTSPLSSQNVEIYLQKYLPISGKPSITNYLQKMLLIVDVVWP